jgi:four helix bundle protein
VKAGTEGFCTTKNFKSLADSSRAFLSKFPGLLAQLVQSTASTRQGSLVRAQYSPQIRMRMRAKATFSFCFFHSHSVSRSEAFYPMFDFQNLEVYKKSKKVYSSVTDLLNEIKPGRIITDQLSRASLSVVLNIAEGSGKFSKPDRRNFFVIARGSVFECVALLDVLREKGQISQETFDRYLKIYDELSRILYAMIKNLS